MMTPDEKRAREQKVRRDLHRIHASRKAAGKCRHCGGAVPCWSALGDQSVGRKHTTASYARRVTGGGE